MIQLFMTICHICELNTSIFIVAIHMLFIFLEYQFICLTLIHTNCRIGISRLTIRPTGDCGLLSSLICDCAPFLILGTTCKFT